MSTSDYNKEWILKLVKNKNKDKGFSYIDFLDNLNTMLILKHLEEI